MERDHSLKKVSRGIFNSVLHLTIMSVALPLIKICRPGMAKEDELKLQLSLEFLGCAIPLIYCSFFSKARDISVIGSEMNGLFSKSIIRFFNRIVESSLNSSYFFLRSIVARVIFIPYGVIIVITRIIETVLLGIPSLACSILLLGKSIKVHKAVIQNFRYTAIIEDLVRCTQGIIDPSLSIHNYFLIDPKNLHCKRKEND